MSERGVRGIVLAHGDMAQGLIDAVRYIAGMSGDFLVPLSNRGLSPEALTAEIARMAGDEQTIVFTDLQSGSCGFAARRCIQTGAHIVCVSGVNLPMLLEFVMKRDLPFEELIGILVTKGRAAIACTPNTAAENHEHRAVSRG